MSDEIINSSGAFTDITTFVSGVSGSGETINYGSTRRRFRANAAVTKGQAVMWVAPTATVPMSVTPMTAAADPRLFAGIAVAVAAAGRYVDVCSEGHCLVYANAQTTAFGDVVKVPGTNTGESSFSATDPDATAIVGTVIGCAQGIKNATTNLTSVIIRHM